MAKQTQSYAAPSARPENELRMQKRATSAGWWGLAMQAFLAVVALVLMMVGSRGAGAVVPLASVFGFALLGIIPWLAVLVATAFRRAAVVEEYELEAARRTGDAERTIFASEADARPAARRLTRVYKWGLPIAAGLLGLFLVLRGLSGLNAAHFVAFYELNNARYLAGLFAGFAFVGFVLGRYLLGMSTQPAWSMLRGGATYLIGTVYIFAMMAVAAGAIALGTDAVNGVVRYIVPLFALLVGIEVLLNIVLDLYRPKSPDEAPRPAFDSRLLALLASPGDIVQSLNEAVNYQFGFEITRSWFWRLLSRSFAWLVLFGILVLVLLSSIVVVEPHQQALLTNLGGLRAQPLGPGVHFKLPWPLAAETKYPVDRIQEMVVGSHDELHRGEPLLWTNTHAHGEDLMIVAGGDLAASVDAGIPAPLSNFRLGSGGRGLMTPMEATDDELATSGPAPDVGLAAIDVVVQWKIDAERLIDFATATVEPQQRLRHLANAAVMREMLRYDVDEVIGPARSQLAAAIENRLRDAIRQERLGIDIVWVGVAGVHPPQAVAEDFNTAAAAIQRAKRSIEEARRRQTEILTEAAGSVEAAQTIVREHDRLQALRQEFAQVRTARASGEATDEQVQQAEALVGAQQAELERLIQRAGGAAGRQLLQARGDRWSAENNAVAQAALQPGELAAYREAPRYYSYRRYLQVLSSTMADKRKFLLMSDDASPGIEIDLKEAITALSNREGPQRMGEGRE